MKRTIEYAAEQLKRELYTGDESMDSRYIDSYEILKSRHDCMLKMKWHTSLGDVAYFLKDNSGRYLFSCQ